MSTNQNRLFFRIFLGLIVNLLFAGIAIGGDILLNEEIGGEVIIYRISPDGTNLNKIGQGFFPQWSPDGKYISYVEYFKIADPSIVRGLVVIESTGKEIFRISGRIDITSIVRYLWNPNGKGIALVTVFGRHKGSILYYDIATKQIKTLHKIEFQSLDMAFLLTSLEWSSDGKLLLFSSGSALPEGQGFVLIDIEKETVKNLSEVGILPRFMGNKVLFVMGSEIWNINFDGSDKKRLFDAGMPIISLSKIVNDRTILQIDAKSLDQEFPFRLYLLNLDNKMHLKEIGSENHLLLSPSISPDGKKFTAIGMRLRKDGQFVSEEESELGYYIVDISTEKITLLKRFEERNKSEGFWWGVYYGYGNHTSWN